MKYHRSVYDALFVALTQDLGLPGITADEPLYNAVHVDFRTSSCCAIGHNPSADPRGRKLLTQFDPAIKLEP